MNGIKRYECIQVQIHNMIWKYNKVNKGIGDGDDVDDDDGDRCGGLQDPSPFSLCVVVMVEIFVEVAMEAAEQQGSALDVYVDGPLVARSSPL